MHFIHGFQLHCSSVGGLTKGVAQNFNIFSQDIYIQKLQHLLSRYISIHIYTSPGAKHIEWIDCNYCYFSFGSSLPLPGCCPPPPRACWEASGTHLRSIRYICCNF